MKVAIFSTRSYDRQFLELANKEAGFPHELEYFETNLNTKTASLAQSFPCVCIFVNDTADAAALKILAKQGTKLIALRCAGYNMIDILTASELGIKVVRVPAYSPYAVAEHAVGLILMLNRKLNLVISASYSLLESFGCLSERFFFSFLSLLIVLPINFN